MGRRASFAIGAGVVAIAAAAAGTWAWKHYVSEPDEQMLADVAAIESDPCARPSHVEKPDPGSFGDKFEAAAPALRAVKTATASGTDADLEKRRQVLDGEAPASEMPAAWLSALEQNRDGLRIALEATHAQSARPSAGMSLFADPNRPSARDGISLLLTAGTLAAVDVAEKTAAGHADDAAHECVDAIALARDAEWGTGVLGATAGGSMLRRLAPPCARAFDAASMGVKQESLRQLDLVEKGFPPFSRAIRNDDVYADLMVFGPTLSWDRLGRLSPDAHAAVLAAGYGGLSGWWLRVPRRSHRALVEEEIAAADLPLPELTKSFAAIRSRADRHRITSALYMDYGKFADRQVRHRAWLDVLRAGIAADLFRAGHPQWPSSMRELVEAGALPAAVIDRRTAEPVGFRVEDGALAIPAQKFADVMPNGPERDAPVLRFSPDAQPRSTR